MRIGLKLHSTDCNSIPILSSIRKKLDYIELFVAPDSVGNIEQWKETGIPYFLHAPHSYAKLNFSLSSAKENNNSLLKETEDYRLSLNPIRIIFHPGIDGSIEETVGQINFFKNIYPELFKIALIENKPKIGIKGENCIGSSPLEIERIINETGIGFCLDVGHAIYYSAWANISHETILDEFLKLHPFMFHLSDGIIESHTDIHLNFGKGNFDLKKILSKLPISAYLTIETDHRSNLNLINMDLDYISNLC